MPSSSFRDYQAHRDGVDIQLGKNTYKVILKLYLKQKNTTMHILKKNIICGKVLA